MGEKQPVRNYILRNSLSSRPHTAARTGYRGEGVAMRIHELKGSLVRFARHVPRGLTRGLENPDGIGPPVLFTRSARLRSCCAPVGTDVRLTRLQVSPLRVESQYSRLFLSLARRSLLHYGRSATESEPGSEKRIRRTEEQKNG